MPNELSVLQSLPAVNIKRRKNSIKRRKFPCFGREIFLIIISFLWGQTAFLGLKLFGLIWWFFITRINSWHHLVYGIFLWSGFIYGAGRGLGPYLVTGIVFYLTNRLRFFPGRKYLSPLPGAGTLLVLKTIIYWDHSLLMMLHYILEAGLLFSGVLILEEPLEAIFRGKVAPDMNRGNKILYLAVLLMIFLGVPPLEFSFFDLQLFLGAFLVFISGSINIAATISTAVLIGFGVDYLQPGYNLLAFYSLLGILLAGFRGLKRWAPIPACLLATGFFTIMGGKSFLLGKLFCNSLLAAGLMFIIPKSIYSPLVSLLVLPEDAGEREVWEYCEGDLRDLFDDYSAAITKLSKFYNYEPEIAVVEQANGQLGELVNTFAEKICSRCKYCRDCWEGNFYDTFHFFTRLSSLDWVKDQLHIKRLLKQRCKNPEYLKQKFIPATRELEKESTWIEAFRVNQKVVATQLAELAKIIHDLGEGFTRDIKKSLYWRKILENFLMVRGLDVQKVKVKGSRERKDVNFEVTFRGCKGRGVCAKTLEFLELEFQQNFQKVALQQECKGQKCCNLKFLPDLRNNVNFGAAGFALGKVSGDKYSFGQLGGAFYAVLSDGMGAGSRAAEISKLTVKVLRELIQMGLKHDRALQILNSVILSHTLEERFATVDLFLLNLYNFEARFIKVGAVPSYIKRGIEIIRLNAPNLPLGILPDLQAEEQKQLLRPGDLVILITDGVIENREGQDDTWLRQLLSTTNLNDPKALADAVLNEATVCRGDYVDDRTVLVIKVN